MQVHRGSLLYERLYTHRDKSKPTENLISNLPLIYCLTGLFWQVIVLSSRGENEHLLLDFTLQWAASVPVRMSEIPANRAFKLCCVWLSLRLISKVDFQFSSTKGLFLCSLLPLKVRPPPRWLKLVTHYVQMYRYMEETYSASETWAPADGTKRRAGKRCDNSSLHPPTINH